MFTVLETSETHEIFLNLTCNLQYVSKALKDQPVSNRTFLWVTLCHMKRSSVPRAPNGHTTWLATVHEYLTTSIFVSPSTPLKRPPLSAKTSNKQLNNKQIRLGTISEETKIQCILFVSICTFCWKSLNLVRKPARHVKTISH